MRRAWLQKHPTPLGADGDFHWWPGDVAAATRTRLAGADAPLTLWLAPGQVSWARRFTAVAPADDRRYTGVAAVVVAGDAPTAALLGAAPVPAAAPWHGDDPVADVTVAVVPAPRARCCRRRRGWSPTAARRSSRAWRRR
ncbi:MAG: hypothetical protein H6708_04415 [Kofleriaceae bacterium]|nr:hypothetical protein [Kofleriaceae bacterium]